MSVAGLSFAALDVETANSARGSVCAIGISVVREGTRVGSRSWLCRPPGAVDFFARHNVRVHGISAPMVAGEPVFGAVWPEVVRMVDRLPVVAHNAGFDSGAVREACGHSGIDVPDWDFRCSLAIARRHLDLESYRLPDVAGALGVELIAHHDAGADAAAAADIVVALAKRVGVDSLAELERLGEVRPRRVRDGSVRRRRRSAFPRAELVMPDVRGGDPGHPLFGQVVVFTGELAAMSRQEAWDAIAACGATPARNVTRRTTCLVIGDGFDGVDPGAFTTVKARRVEELRAKGFQIEVMDERRLLACLDPVRHAAGPGTKRIVVIS
ncbi:exonuclease domain-containing protein [Nocardia otitidiscaviarum]|uniref:exonuclease domain-containing protein n=1 Tax=Nocardia otitidiscaviarum TaxID=1823 RepID=UPI002B4B7C4B|nr:exonuclease domain-containing protein [Nocardia otitidiscaviarum]